MFLSTIGSESLHAFTNDTGQCCINFAASRGMVVRSTYFPRKDIHKATWTLFLASSSNMEKEKLAKALHRVVSKIWEEDKLPNDWMD